MMSTGSRGWRACSASMSRTPSIGSIRRSRSATSKRWLWAASSALPPSSSAVTSKFIARSRISRMSRMPRSSSTSSRRRFIVAEPARPARTVGGLSQGRVASFLAALLEEQIDLLEAFQIFSHLAEVGVALDQLLVELRDLLLELRQLRARRDDRGRRPAAHPGARHRPVVDVPREELVVGGDRGLVAPLLDEPVRPREQRRRRRRSHERPALRRRAARGEHQYERERRGAVHTRGRSTLNRPPFPSCDSTVTRPPWARATSLTIASPSPVPPRSRCAWRYDSKMWGISPAGIPTPVSSTWSASSGSA